MPELGGEHNFHSDNLQSIKCETTETGERTSREPKHDDDAREKNL